MQSLLGGQPRRPAPLGAPTSSARRSSGTRDVTERSYVERNLACHIHDSGPVHSPEDDWATAGRHWFSDAYHRAGMNPEVRSALTGHSAKMDESAGHGVGMRSFVKVLAEAMATIGCPMEPLRKG
jgi:hypothetical protein